jgi:hypothetical protein
MTWHPLSSETPALEKMESIPGYLLPISHEDSFPTLKLQSCYTLNQINVAIPVKNENIYALCRMKKISHLLQAACTIDGSRRKPSVNQNHINESKESDVNNSQKFSNSKV